MNIDVGKDSFTPEEIDALRAKTLEWKTRCGYSWATVQSRTGVAAGTVSQWVPATYKGDNQAIAVKMHRFFLHLETQETIERDAPIVPAFRQTKTAGRVMGNLAWAHRGKFTVVVGLPGVGKTAAVDQYVGTNPNVWRITVAPSSGKLNAMLLALSHAMGGRRQCAASAALTSFVRERLAGRRALVVVDEAQRLAPDALEELRALHDETGCGLALVGNPEVLSRVEGASRSAAFAQLYSRISLRTIINRPDDSDVETLLEAWEITNGREREFLRKIALASGGGGVRSLTNTLEYATVLAQGEDEGPRLLEHIQEAWAALSTRAAAA